MEYQYLKYRRKVSYDRKRQGRILAQTKEAKNCLNRLPIPEASVKDEQVRPER